MNRTHEITELLQAWGKGDSHALSKLIPLVDDELKKIARAKMAKERSGHILQTTALINEALMRLIATEGIDWQSRTQFYGLVAKRMRQVLVDYARKQRATKRGKRPEHVDINEAVFLSSETSEELIMLDQALTKFAKTDELKVKIIEHCYFGGLTQKEVAQILDIPLSTVESEWRLAKAWLKRELTSESENLP
jgi:RNA polymerase sigma-70 factor, ECF subfamily